MQPDPSFADRARADLYAGREPRTGLDALTTEEIDTAISALREEIGNCHADGDDNAAGRLVAVVNVLLEHLIERNEG